MRYIRIMSALLLLYIGSSQAGFAASLLSDYSVKAEFERSTAVIVGTVVAERATIGKENGDILNF